MRGGIDVQNIGSLTGVLNELRPQIILNGVGVTLRRTGMDSATQVIQINSLLPHQLADWCDSNRAKMFHYSTDCVFSGEKGGYTEDDPMDADDLYGRSKALGEVSNRKCAVTIRSSIVGREIENKTELFEWFLSQNGKTVKGYTKALYTGVTTNYMAQLTLELVQKHPQIYGLQQVASPIVSKFDLLKTLGEVYAAKHPFHVTIEANPSVEVLKNLNGDRFTERTGIRVPSWKTMLENMVADPTPYESF
jgi:dTDP-4-dehydrorhamnose reductase